MLQHPRLQPHPTPRSADHIPHPTSALQFWGGGHVWPELPVPDRRWGAWGTIVLEHNYVGTSENSKPTPSKQKGPLTMYSGALQTLKKATSV